MYVVTFYSFKGGVGRTMALVNVAFQLAKQGRRVLVVDLDLEAPGLTTFDALKPPTSANRGFVDFVCDYLESNSAPDVRDYLHDRSDAVGRPEALWVMPAGRLDGRYDARLHSIDWGRLYDQRDGYVLMEDLRAQWQEFVRPDYVLVDSRTGHTDVGGICTRQLPDAVVFLFFPNAQNLDGLRTIVPEVRKQSESGNRVRDLHFVVSNVPDLDDEDSILAKRMEAFSTALGYQKLTATIHHYDSLALLNQVVFTIDRVRSRLAREYVALASEISMRNPADRQGAIDLLSRRRPEIVLSAPAREADGARLLKEIEQAQGSDPEILAMLGATHEDRGDLATALSLLNQALKLPWRPGAGSLRRSAVLVRRNRLAHVVGPEQSTEDECADLLAILDSSEATFPEIRFAISRLARLEPALLSEDRVARSKSVLGLPVRERVALIHDPDERMLAVGQVIADDIMRMPELDSLEEATKVPLALVLIASGRFGDAMALMGPGRPDPAAPSLAITTAFNYAIAEWGHTGRVPTDLFEAVVRLDAGAAPPNRPESANYCQCLALAHWATGDREAAVRLADQAVAALADAPAEAVARQRRVTRELEAWRGSRPDREFSSWRYLLVNRKEFVADIEDFLAMVRGEERKPAVFSRRQQGPTHIGPQARG